MPAGEAGILADILVSQLLSEGHFHLVWSPPRHRCRLRRQTIPEDSQTRLGRENPHLTIFSTALSCTWRRRERESRERQSEMQDIFRAHFSRRRYMVLFVDCSAKQSCTSRYISIRPRASAIRVCKSYSCIPRRARCDRQPLDPYYSCNTPPGISPKSPSCRTSGRTTAARTHMTSPTSHDQSRRTQGGGRRENRWRR